jgi:hypothetical protein
MNETELLQKLIPYRMQAVDTLNYALRLRSRWSDAPGMTMHVDGKQVMEGNLNAFTNPAIEAGLVHCRALLELLGLCEKEGRLSNRKKRQPGDVGIEHFRSSDGPLKMVPPEVALSRYDGGRDEAERALLTVFHLTNKGLAHITADLADHPEHGRLLDIASRGIPVLVISYLYTPLGMAAPNYKITSRAREA